MSGDLYIGKDIIEGDPEFASQFRDIALAQIKADDAAVMPKEYKPVRYVVVWNNQQYYGGPEEGGWYGWNHYVVCWARCTSEDTAIIIKERIQREMIDRQNHDLDARRIEVLKEQYDAAIERDPHGDLDGPDDDRAGLYENYSVNIQDTMPEDEFGPRHYE